MAIIITMTDLFCNIPDYDTMAIIITRTEEVFVRRFSPHLVAAIARAINNCDKNNLCLQRDSVHVLKLVN